MNTKNIEWWTFFLLLLFIHGFFLSSFRQWREKQKEILAERDEEAEKKKQETIKKAHEDIDKFYEDYNEKKQKAIEENR